MAERSVFIRIAVRDGEQALTALKRLGTEGEQAAARIGTAMAGANPRLQAFDRNVATARDSLRGFSQAALVMGGPLGRLSGEASALAGTIRTVGVGAAASVAGITLLTAGYVAAVRAAEEATQAQLRLEAGLRATGHRAGLTAREVQDFARGLSTRTVTGARDAEAAVLTLTRSTTLTGAELLRATELAASLGVAMGRDTAAGAEVLGRALADPVKGFEELRRLVPALDPVLARTIAQFAETGRAGQAAATILDELQRTIGGEAGRGTGTLTNATRTLGEEWNKLLSNLGNTAPIRGATAAVTESVRRWNEALRDDTLRELTTRQGQLGLRLGNARARFNEPGRAGGAARAEAAAIERETAELQTRIDALTAEREAARSQSEQQAARERQAKLLAIEDDTERQRLALKENTIARLKAAETKAIAELEALRRPENTADIDKAIAARQQLTLQQIDQAGEAERKAAEARAKAAEESASRQLIANEEVVAGLQFELEQMQRNDKERFVEAETRKLSAEATELQIRASRELAGRLYEEQRAAKAAADAAAERVREQNDINRELDRLDPRFALRRQRARVEELKDYGLDPEIAAKELRRIDEELRRLELSTTQTGRAWLAMEDATFSALEGIATRTLSVKDAINQLSQVALNFFVSEGFEALRGMLTGRPGDYHYGPPASSSGSLFGNLGGLFGGSTPSFGSYGPQLPGSGGFGSFLTDIGGFFAGLFHDGGVVGAGGQPQRQVPSWVFAGAPEYHGGGVAGLMPNERPAILEVGERVLSRRERAQWERQAGPITLNYSPSFPNVRERRGFGEAESQSLAAMRRLLARTQGR